MRNSLLLAAAWCAVAIHAAVGIAARRHPGTLVPLLNLATGVGIVLYWIPRWYAYATRGVIWYASDQLVPLWGVGVIALSVLGLVGVPRHAAPHWIAFSVHAAVLVAAALFFSIFRVSRLM